jgi:hypothetical protein
MRPDDVRELLRQRPFQPFFIYLTDGTVYRIRHPDQIAVSRSTVVIGFRASPDPDALLDPVVTVSLLHIIRFEPILSAEQQPSV